MVKGKIYLSCGCEYNEEYMGPLECLIYSFDEQNLDYDTHEVVTATVTGLYCKECQKVYEQL